VTRPNPSDSDAIEAIAARYGPAIKAYFSRRIVDRNEVEDMTQEVFLSLVRRGELKGIDSLERYIFRSAANLLRERHRRASRRPDISVDGSATSDLLIEEISPERSMLGAEAWELFVTSLQELPERARTIFILNRFEELSGREIALRLGISQSLVEKEMTKAIAYLRGRLA
jgi:RNA polymerase sigma-70 factor (ECF subfamily)